MEIYTSVKSFEDSGGNLPIHLSHGAYYVQTMKRQLCLLSCNLDFRITNYFQINLQKYDLNINSNHNLHTTPVF